MGSPAFIKAFSLVILQFLILLNCLISKGFLRVHFECTKESFSFLTSTILVTCV